MSPLNSSAARGVLLLTSRLGMGGAERHTISLANLLSREFRVAMAYLKCEEDLIGHVRRDAMAELKCLHARKRIDLDAAREVLGMCQRHGLTTIVCANAFALMYAQIARWMSPTPIEVIQIFHTTKLRSLKEVLELLFYRPFFWAANHVVFVCDAQRRHWRRRALWGRSTHTIYNGVDPSHFDPRPFEADAARLRAAAGFAPGDRVVGICAVLRPEKRHADLLAALARCRAGGKPWKAMIIGDGPLRSALDEQARQLGVADDVFVTGYQSDVRPWLAACDALTLPSSSESFSIAALEAMSMGKPMLMSDVGGAREQVEHGVNGLVFAPGDVAAFANCLDTCWDPHRARAMGVAARARVERDFSISSMVEHYEALLRAADRQHAPSPEPWPR